MVSNADRQPFYEPFLTSEGVVTPHTYNPEPGDTGSVLTPGEVLTPQPASLDYIRDEDAAHAIANVEATRGRSEAQKLEHKLAARPELAAYPENQQENVKFIELLLKKYPHAFTSVVDRLGRQVYLTIAGEGQDFFGGAVTTHTTDKNKLRARMLLSPAGFLMISARTPDSHSNLRLLDEVDFTDLNSYLSDPNHHGINAPDYNFPLLGDTRTDSDSGFVGLDVTEFDRQDLARGGDQFRHRFTDLLNLGEHRGKIEAAKPDPTSADELMKII